MRSSSITIRGWPIGLMVFIGNLPLFLIGWRFLGGRRFALRTAFAVAVLSIVTDLIPRLHAFPPNGITDDLFLNSLYGAVVSGVGYGLVYRARATSGGSDILARILNHYRAIPMTQSYLLVDSVVVLAAGFVFGWKQALYAIITLVCERHGVRNGPGRAGHRSDGNDRNWQRPGRLPSECWMRWNGE